MRIWCRTTIGTKWKLTFGSDDDERDFFRPCWFRINFGSVDEEGGRFLWKACLPHTFSSQFRIISGLIHLNPR